MSGEIEMVMELACCTRDVAEQALHDHRDVVSAVDALLVKPPCRGTERVGRVVDSGLTEEQVERCARGRVLQDKISALFSVAQAKMKVQQVQQALADAQQGGQ